MKWMEEKDVLAVMRRPSNKRKAFVAELKANPGRWAEWELVLKHPRQLAADLNSKFPGVKAISRTIDGVTKVYAMWPK